MFLNTLFTNFKIKALKQIKYDENHKKHVFQKSILET